MNPLTTRRVVRAIADKVTAETAVASTRTGTVVRQENLQGFLGHVWVTMDGPDTEPICVECPMTVPPLGERVTVVFVPPNGAFCLAPGSGGVT